MEIDFVSLKIKIDFVGQMRQHRSDGEKQLRMISAVTILTWVGCTTCPWLVLVVWSVWLMGCVLPVIATLVLATFSVRRLSTE